MGDSFSVSDIQLASSITDARRTDKLHQGAAACDPAPRTRLPQARPGEVLLRDIRPRPRRGGFRVLGGRVFGRTEGEEALGAGIQGCRHGDELEGQRLGIRLDAARAPRDRQQGPLGGKLPSPGPRDGQAHEKIG